MSNEAPKINVESSSTESIENLNNSGDLIDKILDKKKPIYTEIQVFLFEKCNLNCVFCGQDHSSIVGMDSILNKIEPIKKFISNNRTKLHYVNIMGGELFSDDISDDVFDKYYELIKSVDEHAKKLGHQCRFNLPTNLIYKNTIRVEKFFEKLNVSNVDAVMSTSYDFYGRKTKNWDQSLFESNVEYFKHRLNVVNVVLTKQGIKSMITEKDEYFDYLYENFTIFTEYYQLEPKREFLMPTDDELLMGLKYLAVNYPKSYPISDLLADQNNHMTCYALNTLTIMADGTKYNCKYLNEQNKKSDFASTAKVIEEYISKTNCLTCQYYSRCGFRCFYQHKTSERSSSSECIFKNFYVEFG